ncbi:MAG TPA: hypothetical protein VI299_01370 [Polyangiales bacterium]
MVLAWFAPRAVVHADAKTDARTTFELGVEASHAQKWDEARTYFQRSLELLPKASTMFNLAVADIKLGLGREALEQLDAFERAASPSEHAQMLERAQVLRPQAQALVDSEQATAEHGGNVLSHTDDGLTDELRQQVQQARDDYARGRDREALSGFEQAYKTSRRAELLYNIGVVADRLREDRKAARAYDMFVAAMPDAPAAAVAQVRSDALHAAMAERERAGEEAARASQAVQGPREDRGPAPSVPKPRMLLITGVSMMAGAAVGGGLLGGLMSDKLRDYNRCIDRADCNNKDEVRRDRAFTYAGFAVVGAVGAAGLGLTIAGGVQYGRAKRTIERALGPVTPSIAIGPGGGMLTLGARF